LIGDTVSVPVALLALIGTDYAATERGTVLTVAPIDTEHPIESLGDLLDTPPDRTGAHGSERSPQWRFF
jgi:hypothetical protein